VLRLSGANHGQRILVLVAKTLFSYFLIQQQGLAGLATTPFVDQAVFCLGIHPIYRVDSATKNTNSMEQHVFAF
jgi:hypothetical protein